MSNTITKDELKNFYNEKNPGQLQLPNFYDMVGDERLNWANDFIKAGKLLVNHGEAFHWLGQEYRNENLLFWHEKDGAMYPYTEIDDYGSVPPCFEVGNGFMPYSWEDDVDHNRIIFLCDELVSEINTKLKINNGTYECIIKIYGESFTVESEKAKVSKAFQYYDGTLTAIEF